MINDLKISDAELIQEFFVTYKDVEQLFSEKVEEYMLHVSGTENRLAQVVRLSKLKMVAFQLFQKNFT